MKKYTLPLTVAAFIALNLLVFSCDKNNVDKTDLLPDYDCPEIEKNFGDTCRTGGAIGKIDSNCVCKLPTFDCPTLKLNIGDSCKILGTTLWGKVGPDCKCKL